MPMPGLISGRLSGKNNRFAHVAARNKYIFTTKGTKFLARQSRNQRTRTIYRRGAEVAEFGKSSIKEKT